MPKSLDNVEYVYAFTNGFVCKRADIFYRCTIFKLVLEELLEIPVRNGKFIIVAKQILKCRLIWPELVYCVQEIRVDIDQRRHCDSLIFPNFISQLFAVEAKLCGDLDELRQLV